MSGPKFREVTAARGGVCLLCDEGLKEKGRALLVPRDCSQAARMLEGLTYEGAACHADCVARATRPRAL